MPIDPGRIIRIRSTIEAAAASDGIATGALMDLYTVSRDQLVDMLDSELLDEFRMLFPTWQDRTSRGGITTAEAKTRLRAIVGWLNGLVEGMQYDVQIEANAEAYARERVRSERGIGFKADD